MNDEQNTKAVEVATRIGKALVKKFPKHNVFVRRYGIGDKEQQCIVEIALRPENKIGVKDEISTSYTSEFFSSATKDTIKEKAQRVHRDFLSAFECR